jgi:hypothetical protein
MIAVENETRSGVTIFIDGKHFINCRYTNCTLIFAGGDFGWTNTTFKSCQIRFSGSADRTVSFMRNFNLLPTGFRGGKPTPPPADQSVN